MPKPICGDCNIERRIGSHGGQNGVEVVIMAGQRKYKAYSSDKWVCPICGNIEYHIARDTNTFWTEASDAPPPDAIPIWETIDDAQAALEPTFNYVVSVRGGAGSGVLAVKKSLPAAKKVIADCLESSEQDSYLHKEKLLEDSHPAVHCFDYKLKQDPGLDITFTFYITVLERGAG